jgi:anti-sigma B factor antagonist
MKAQPHATDNNVLVIAADDSINDDTAEMVVLQLESQIVKESSGKVILDCSRIEFLSSYGLGIILRLRNAANMVNGELKLSCVNGLLERTMQISRVGHLFTIHTDVEQARQAFKAKGD